MYVVQNWARDADEPLIAVTRDFFVQVNATSGVDMEYIFSHSTFAGSTGYTDDPWGANQVITVYTVLCSAVKLL